MKSYWVYILKCSDDSYYTGCTSRLEKRIAQHQSGVVEGYTSSRLPVELVYAVEFTNVEEALRIERQVKNWSRKKKEALIEGNLKLLHALAECRNGSHFHYK